jgi:hypothetical protein
MKNKYIQDKISANSHGKWHGRCHHGIACSDYHHASGSKR